MAVHGRKAKVFAGGLDLSSMLRKAGVPGSVETSDATTFQMNSKARVAGNLDGKFTGEGLFPAAVAGTPDAVEVALQAALGADETIFTYCTEGDAIGKRSRSIVAVTTAYEIESPADDVVSVKVEAESGKGKGVDAGLSLHPWQDEAGDGQGANVDHGASSANGAALILHADCDAAETLTAKVQHSVDNSVWVDLGTFTAVGVSTEKAERIEVAGTVNRHLRASWTRTGTPRFAVFASRK